MSEPLGFVVVARRPNPWAQDPWDYWAVGRLYRTEAAAVTALAKGELSDDIEREAVAWRIDQDSKPAHAGGHVSSQVRSYEWWETVGPDGNSYATGPTRDAAILTHRESHLFLTGQIEQIRANHDPGYTQELTPICGVRHVGALT